MATKKKEKEPEIIKEEIKGFNFYEDNNKSTKYNFNEDFATKVANEIFKWFVNNDDIYFYSEFPRKYMGLTYDFFMMKMREFPFIFNNIEKELKIITTERIASQMLKNKVNAYGAI